MASAGGRKPWKPLGDKPRLTPRLPLDKGGVGTLGRPIHLFTNHFPVTFKKTDIVLHHFDVTIEDVWMDKDDREKAKTGEGAAPSAAAAATEGARGVGAEGARGDGAEGAKGGGARRKNKKSRKGWKKGNAPKAEEAGDADEEDSAVVKDEPSADGESTAVGSGKGALKSRIPRRKLRRIFKAFIDDFPRIFKDHPMTYDGEKNAYSASCPPQLSSLPFSNTFIFNDELEQRQKKYKVVLKKVNQAKLQTLLSALAQPVALPTPCQTIFQMLEVMFNYERTVTFETVSRNRFFNQEIDQFGRKYGVGGGKEGVVGFFASLRPAAGWKSNLMLTFNVDVAHAAFYHVQSLMGFLQEQNIHLDGKAMDFRTVKAIQNELIKKDIRIVTTHTPFKRKYKVTGVSTETPRTHVFDLEEGASSRKVNIIQYFKERYKYDIKYPDMPCLKVGNKGNLMPIEVCEIAPNQKVKGKLDDRETAEFIKQTAVHPQVRLNQIKEVMHKNEFHLDPYLKHMGVEISEKPLALQGRVLPTPILEMASSKKALVKQGVWDIRENKFYQPKELTNWVFVNFGRLFPDVMKRFIQQLLKLGRDRGMNIQPPLEVIERGQDPARTLSTIMKRRPDVQLIMCALEKNDDVYKKIKSIGDRELHVVTQCVLTKNVVKLSDATVGNLLLKMNAKIGGINHISYYENVANFSQLFNEPVLVMGADVNHPPAGDRTAPSLVAVVGSLDRNASKYAIEVRHQDHREEMISDMEAITKSLLLQFHRVTKYKPCRIIMFRDGVSETQFTQVLLYELRAMRAACSSLHKDYQPAITFICVQKRHHTRLFCSNRADAMGRPGNIPPGTVVDTTITQRNEADFFLCSHLGIQGTSKPSHYHVLWDDSDFTMDQLELLTYSMCHNYSRCTRAVSIPTPAYYAHLAAFRAKVHLEGSSENNVAQWSEAAMLGTGAYPSEFLHKHTVIGRDSILGDKMFYI